MGDFSIDFKRSGNSDIEIKFWLGKDEDVGRFGVVVVGIVLRQSEDWLFTKEGWIWSCFEEKEWFLLLLRLSFSFLTVPVSEMIFPHKISNN